MDLKQSSNQAISETSSYRRPRSTGYSIDQAIQLVSSLKGHKVSAQVIASIIKQTLESVDIHFSDIIADAKTKESAIQAEKNKRDELIKSLVQQVENLQKEKADFQKELNKTIFVREFLQQALITQPASAAEAADSQDEDDAADLQDALPLANVVTEPASNPASAN